MDDLEDLSTSANYQLQHRYQMELFLIAECQYLPLVPLHFLPAPEAELCIALLLCRMD